MKCLIRDATEADLAQIYQLVIQLAAYEDGLDQVKTTLEDYRKAFAEGVFEALVATQDGLILGTTIYYLTWSTWRGRMLYLEDFVVHSDYRGRGIGHQLFDAYLAKARAMNCTMVKWQVLDWNSPALNFYAQYDAIIEKDWWNGKIIFSTEVTSSEFS